MAFIDYLWSAIPIFGPAPEARVADEPSEIVRAGLILGSFLFIGAAVYAAHRLSGFLFERAAFLVQFAFCMIMWEFARIVITPARLAQHILGVAAFFYASQLVEPILNATLHRL
jgi:hypothetical protein